MPGAMFFAPAREKVVSKALEAHLIGRMLVAALAIVVRRALLLWQARWRSGALYGLWAGSS